MKARRHSSAPREGEDEKKGGKERHSSQLTVWRRVCQQGRPVQLTTSASHTHWTSPLLRNAYTVSLTAATARHHVSVPGVGGDTEPFTTSTAPISAKRSSLRRVRSRMRRSRPTHLCRHSYSATASTSLSIKRRRRRCVGRVEVRFGWRSGVQPVGAVFELVLVYISNA